MPIDEETPREGDIRAKVLEIASSQLASAEAVPDDLLIELKVALDDERPPKAAALVALIEKHFKGTAL